MRPAKDHSCDATFAQFRERITPAIAEGSARREREWFRGRHRAVWAMLVLLDAATESRASAAALPLPLLLGGRRPLAQARHWLPDRPPAPVRPPGLRRIVARRRSGPAVPSLSGGKTPKSVAARDVPHSPESVAPVSCLYRKRSNHSPGGFCHLVREVFPNLLQL